MDSIKIEGDGYYLLAKRVDRSWGNAVEITIYKYDHELLGKLSFCCHPEFDDFDLYQSFETELLVKIASERVAKELPLGKYQQAWEAGVILLQRFNSPGA